MRILIVEDEKVAARGLQRMVQDLLGDAIQQIGWEATLEKARQTLQENQIDILFLDLNLNGEDGFELLKEAVADAYHTIVVSANENQAIKAFEYGVLDFVPKPVSKERLEKALKRLNGNQEAVRPATFLPIRKAKGVALIKLDEVSFFRGDGNNVEVRLKSGGSEYHRRTLDSLAQTLPNRFSRIHRSVIVDLNEVNKLVSQGGGKYQVELKDGSSLPLSRAFHKVFRQEIFD
jgi:two-component system, LytTR family, response regulator LytT